MTRIVDTGISIASQTSTHVQLILGVDTRFTGVDLFEGQTGASIFEMFCVLWDEDTFFNNRIAKQSVVMHPGSILEETGIDMTFDLSLAELRKEETGAEGVIELFGEFTLRKNGVRIGPSVKGRNMNVAL